MKVIIGIFRSLALCFVVLMAVVSCGRKADYQELTGYAQGGTYSVKFNHSGVKTGISEIRKSVDSILTLVDTTLSGYNKGSQLSRFNAGVPVVPNEMFREIFTISKRLYDETGGALDMASGLLYDAWGFGFKTGNPPTQQTVDSLRAIVGFQKVTLKEEHVKKQNPHIMLDCSAIAKGYGSDIVARFLKKKGIQNFMVEIGGEIVVNGNSDKQVPWRVGINKPTDDSLNTNQELQDVINVTDIAMATSGNYRNFYYKNGKKYAHTIDPKTGYPVQHNILSATVLAKNCATADSYATSFMVMGLDGARKVLEKHPELDAYLIYSDEKGNNRIWYSPELKKKILK